MEEPRRLGNRYELGAVLGRGGMAEVFMARDIRLGRAVAVKTLRADMARDATFQARFRREAQSAASLNHPAIVAVYDTGEDYIGGVSLPYIVMEYVDGSTLRDLLHSGRRLLPERALEITSGVLQALDYSHRNGIIHRDIKPANVMLTRAGAVKVMDFGIARAMGDQGMTMTQTSAVIGTAQYLSPEQAKGETVDARSDLYSTGCLLYELLTGRPPFVGDSPVAVAYQHVREAPLPPSHHDPEVPAVADAIVLKSLGKHPDERYQSADEMRADIERALDGRPIAAAPTLVAGYGAANAPTQVVPSAAGYGGGQTTAGYGPPTRYQPTQYQPSYEDGPADDPVRRRGDGAGGAGGRGKKSNDKAGYIILAVVAVIAVVLAIVVFNKLLGGGANGKSTTVPSITNKSVAQAQTALQANNLKLGSNTCSGDAASSTTVPAGQIISQSPQTGAVTTEGTSVNYCLSTGATQKKLPDTKALNTNTKDTVETTLKGSGFTNLQEQDQASSTVPAGNVIDLQDGNGKSLAGQVVPVTTQITVVVSSGPGNATVPPVLGQTCTQALQAVQGAGFQTQQVNQFSSEVQGGYAINTDPGANAQAGKGTVVKVYCSNGASPSPTPSPSPSPSASASGGGGLLGGGGGNGG
ncbi:Stk1 family PASTA domain-containing Ser/Thr kinase [Actinocrinis puniceicyclus]|uniref:non-specific serine/threonine protein kinase n=1 Tax=Actinocrinis puniceicyclus TaxID=977794 RepID=A0A8J7WJJ5_9ACTN|nr:Stk1 family PASTA domain-containing Ser/Thr kinase [Actinocrinis puniceicyclus]MBS2962075.1 Stk1 family PASTA domain-containing Ser/Thr kinase [Actinocrinis puniceicyclus]